MAPWMFVLAGGVMWIVVGLAGVLVRPRKEGDRFVGSKDRMALTLFGWVWVASAAASILFGLAGDIWTAGGGARP